jgi:TRAP-type uncharacterized transport system substrate-binding protein
VLELNGVEKGEVERFSLANTPAVVELLEGRIDGLVFTSAPEAPLIQMLLQTPGIRLFDFSQAEAYARKLPFLTHVVLPQGIVDLGRDIPSEDYNLIAPTATLVAREDLHPALVDLFVQAASGFTAAPAGSSSRASSRRQVHRDPGRCAKRPSTTRTARRSCSAT